MGKKPWLLYGGSKKQILHNKNNETAFIKIVHKNMNTAY